MAGGRAPPACCRGSHNISMRSDKKKVERRTTTLSLDQSASSHQNNNSFQQICVGNYRHTDFDLCEVGVAEELTRRQDDESYCHI